MGRSEDLKEIREAIEETEKYMRYKFNVRIFAGESVMSFNDFRNWIRTDAYKHKQEAAREWLRNNPMCECEE